jgi:hypothetical protein
LHIPSFAPKNSGEGGKEKNPPAPPLMATTERIKPEVWTIPGK